MYLIVPTENPSGRGRTHKLHIETPGPETRSLSVFKEITSTPLWSPRVGFNISFFHTESFWKK